MTRPRKWLLGIAAVLLLAVLGASSTVWWAVTTEAGSRWLITKVIGYAEIDMKLQQLAGTLWNGLEVGRLSYEDADRRVELTDLELQVDWSGTNMGHIAVSRLAADRLAFVSLSEPAPDPEPLNLDMPALPVRISATSIELQVADFDGFEIRDIETQELDAGGLDIRVAAATASIGNVQLQLDRLSAQLAADIPLTTELAWQAADGSWSGQATATGRLGQLEVEHDLVGDYHLHSIGTVDLSIPADPSFDVVSSFDEWRYENWIATGGTVRLIGAPTDYRSELAVSVTDGDLLMAQVSGELAGNDTGFTSVALSVTAFDGRAEVTGSAQWSPSPGVDLAVVGTNMDLSSLTAGFATRLDLEVQVAATDSNNFTVDIRRLAGTYRDQPIRAAGIVSREREQWRCQGCDAFVGDNRLQAGGSINSRQVRGMVDIQAPALHQLHPDLAGELRAQGTLRGSIDLPVLSGSASARDLVVPGWTIGSITLTTHSATTENVDADIVVVDLARDGVLFGGGEIRMSGSPDDIDIESDWALQGNSIQIVARVQRENDTIKGSLSRASLDQKETGTWSLTEPVSFSMTPDLVTVAESHWSNGDTQLRIGQLVRGSESLEGEIELTGAPLKWLAAYAPEEVGVDGYVDAYAQLRQAGDEWSGRLDWQQRDTVLHVRLIDGEVFEVAVPTATAQARLAPTGATLFTRLEADGGVLVDLNATASELARDAVIDAQLNASGREFGWIAAFIPEIDEVVGSADAEFTLRGRADDPQLRGELRISDGGVVLPAFNVPLTDIQARLTATSSDSLDLAGDALAGDGRLTFTGSIRDVVSPDPKLEITVRGDGATALDWPDYVLIASPDLSLSGEGNEYEVDGRVRMDRAEIHVRELPEGAVTPSADVSVVGREESDARVSRLSGAIDIELSEQVHVQAFGLDTNLVGELRITLPPKREPRANGELSLVGGFFEMYGQRLEVERGTMLFSGPLDNPFVDVRVVREIENTEGDITVGVDITGRADSLVSTLYSDPAMSESEILSYLVTGRPLGQASSVDGQLISDAAFALGLRQATLITNQVGQAIGLDELVLEGSDQDSAALVAGKQVTPNLFARYRYGVFSSLGEILLRYSLSKSVSIEVGAGEFQSIDVQYTIERD